MEKIIIVANRGLTSQQLGTSDKLPSLQLRSAVPGHTATMLSSKENPKIKGKETRD